jgi:iron complex outermembrane receptor protein
MQSSLGRGIRGCAGAALLALALGAQGAAAQQAGVLTGQVVSEGGEPVAGARVEAAGITVVTDREGRFRVVGVPAGARMRVEALGYRAAERTPSADGPLRVVLAPDAVALAGLEVVSATRSGTPVAAIPGAVTVVGRDEIEAQAATAHGVGEILGRAVPGLSVGTQSMSNFGQSLRGRNVAVLIDGIPQSTLRNVSRDFANIDPAAIERVEVLRGATAIYGDGATGGVINIVTRRPGRGAPSLTTEVGTSSSLASFGDGLGGRVAQTVSGASGAFDYVLNGAVSTTGGFYDAEGDLIPADPHGQGGLADTRSYDVGGKAGLALGAQRFQLAASHYRNDQDTRFTADPSVTAADGKARALPGLRESEPQGTRNTLVSLDWTHDSLLGSRVHGQLYGRDYLTRFRGFDRRVYNRTTGAYVGGHVSQSFVDSRKLGGRLEIDSRPFGARWPSLLWGADYTYENTSQPVAIMDSAVYDATGGLEFQKVGERVWVPPLRPRSLGLFAQAAWSLTDDLLVRGGVRRERIRMHVDDFVTLDDNQVYGGDLAYDPTLFNLGAVWSATGAVNVFANFSQGFSLADVGRILRGAADGYDLGTSRLEAQKVDHYEVGARAAWPLLQVSASVFHNRSELGTTLAQTETGMLEVVRAPERIRGAEATLDLHPLDRLSLGGVWSWTEGEAYNAKLGEYRALNGYRIQPAKLTGYVEHRTLPGWTNRLQVLHSTSRDRPFEDRVDPSKPAGYGEQPIESFTVVDLASTLDVGPGTLRVGIENLLNEQYFDIVSQLDLTDGYAYYTAARGATLNLGYVVRY